MADEGEGPRGPGNLGTGGPGSPVNLLKRRNHRRKKSRRGKQTKPLPPPLVSSRSGSAAVNGPLKPSEVLEICTEMASDSKYCFGFENITQTAVPDKHFQNMHFMNLTFRTLVNKHFQNSITVKTFEKLFILYGNLDRKHLQ